MSTEQTTVTLTLGGKPFTLKPTFNRMRALGRLQGGFLPLFRGVSNVDGETMALIVAIGTNAPSDAVEGIARAVYDHGLEDLVDPLTRFLSLCTNGGRDPAAVRAKPAGDVDAGKATSEVVEPTDGDAPEKGAVEADALTPRESTAA